MIGLDISEHNGYIDFPKLKRERPEIDFLIIRIGWIGNKKNKNTLDTYFEDYYKRAKENGYKIGFYVYNYCNNLSAMQNACDWILHKIKGKPIEMSIFLDMEDSSILSAGKDMLTTMSKYFCDSNCTKAIGSLNKGEKCEAIGIFENGKGERVVAVIFTIDNSTPVNRKIGYLKLINGKVV